MNKIQPGITFHGSRVTFVYVIQNSDHYKIGQSSNVDGVLANARRFDAGARVVTCWPGPESAQAERTLHEGLKQYRIEREQFRLPPEVMQWLASLCDREFAGWLSETNCDPRAIGWNYPRIYSIDNRRCWPAEFFPEDDSYAWAMIISDTKPEYSRVESLWQYDSRVFNSIWLSRPQKFGACPPQPKQNVPRPCQGKDPGQAVMAM